MAYISKGLTLEYKANNPYNSHMTTYWTKRAQAEGAEIGEKMILPGLQEIGELSVTDFGNAYDQIEVTTLADSKHRYTDGLIADTSSTGNTVDFKFLFDPDLFSALQNTMNLEKVGDKEGFDAWTIDIPGEGGGFELTGEITAVKMDSISTNSALTFVMTMGVRSINFLTNI